MADNTEIDLLILCLGANDMLRGIKPNIIKQNLSKIIEILQEKNIKILLTGMLSQDTYGETCKNNFDKIFPELSKKFQIDFLPFLLDGVALNPELNLDDGKHPNSRSVLKIKENLEKN